MKPFKSISAAALTLALAACTTQDDALTGTADFTTDPTAVRISATVGSGSAFTTRTTPESADAASQQKFLSGDQLVLSSSATGQAAVTYTLGADGTTWTPETGKYLKWMNGKNPMNMEAFYPAPHINAMDENNNASLTTFTLPQHQYGEATKNIYIGRADYMTYTGSVTPGDNGTAALTMQRQTARVQVKITAIGSEIDAGESFQVNVFSQYGGIPTDADANKEPKEVGGNNCNFMKQDSVGTALVIPGTGRSDATFLNILRRDSDGYLIEDASGNNITLTVTGIPPMEAGKSYLYNLTVGKDKAEISSVTVKDWTSGGVIEENGGEAEEIYFPDATFVKYLHEDLKVPLTNGKIDPTQQATKAALEAITVIDVAGKADLKSLEGIEYCTGLQTLYCYNIPITSLDVSNCTKLSTLYCSGTPITSLDVSNCTELNKLDCGNTGITALDVSKCTKLSTLYCSGIQISALDVSNCTELSTLNCSNTPITSLNVSNCTKLSELYCVSTQITSLDVSKCTKLNMLDCGYTKITSLDVSNCTELSELYCNNTSITSLDVSKCTKLSTLNCSNASKKIALSLTIKTATYDALNTTDFKGEETSAMVTVIKVD